MTLKEAWQIDDQAGKVFDLNKQLDGLTVLLVEDNYLNAVALRNALSSMGCYVLGPISTVTEGLDAIKKDFDLVVLDINILGGLNTPIAEKLQEKGRPFILVTGYGSPSSLPPIMKTVKRLSKPVSNQALELALCDALNNSEVHPDQ